MPEEMVEYITIEGRSGSGKSTLSHLLRDKLSYAYVRGAPNDWDLWLRKPGILEMSNSERRILRTMVSMTENRFKILTQPTTDFFVVDSMFPFFIESSPKLWDFMIDCVEMGLSNLLPKASFVIDVPRSVASYRVAMRGAYHPNVKVELVETVPDDVTGVPFFHYMAERLDFFHLIDGDRPPEVIFNEVQKILEGIV